MILFKGGWRKDPYRDEPLYKPMPRGLIPDKVDLSAHLPPVRSQGNEPSCVGFGIGGMVTGEAKRVGIYTEWFSPRWIYNGARFLEGRLTEGGAYPSDALNWLKTKGCLLEQYWAYVDDNNSTPPPSHLEDEADDWPLISSLRLADGLDGIRSALADGFLVAVGTPWFESWMDPDDEGRVPEVTRWSPIGGGHEYFLYGYEDGYLWGQNSWGTDWSKGGLFRIPFSAVDVWKATYGYDAHIAAIGKAGEPEPSLRRYRLQASEDGGRTWSECWQS